MDSLNKHVEHISFRQCVTFCEHRQLKGWQPHVQLTVAEISISTIEPLVCSSHKAQLRAQSLHCIVTNLVDHHSMTKPSVSVHGTGFCFRSAMKGWA